MNRHFIKIAAALMVMTALSWSCKEKEEEEYEHMSGTLNYDFPEYVIVGQEVTSYISGILTPSNPRYFWVSHEMDIKDPATGGILNSDTLYSQSITVVVPDEPGEYEIKGYARADKYYSKNKNVTVTAIGGSINDMSGWKKGTEEFTDPRDGAKYNVRNYGSLQWFTQNLRYAGDTANSDPALRDTLGIAYGKSDAIGVVFGRLYSWNDATGGVSGSGLGGGPQGACPEGWSVPTKEDWEDLALAVSGDSLDFWDNWDGLGESLSAPIVLNEGVLWPYSPDNAHTNVHGWNGSPFGNSKDFYAVYENISLYGMWWSSLEDENDHVAYRSIYYNTDIFPAFLTDKDSYGVSVRCVRKIE